MNKILVYVPTYGNTIKEESVDSVKSFSFTGKLDIEIYDGAKLGISGKPENLLAQQNRARQMTIDGDYDALVFVEHDMIPKSEFVQAAWESEKDVVYSPYLLRHGMYRLNTFQYIGDKNLGSSLTNHRLELDRAKKTGLWRISGVGWGCTLIRREVLEKIGFRKDKDNQYSDMLFSRDCLHANIKMYGLFGYESLHYAPEIDTWLEPYKHELGVIMKVIPLQTANVNIDGNSVSIVKDVPIDLPGKFVPDLVRAGYVVPESEMKVETKTVAKKRRVSKRKTIKPEN